MEVGLVGLGERGFLILERLVAGEHKVFAYDDSEALVAEAEKKGAVGLSSIEELVRMRGPRTVWVTMPAGRPTDEILDRLGGLLTAEDTILDAGDSAHADTLRWDQRFKQKEIFFLDVVVDNSGGSPALKIGGAPEAIQRATPFLEAIAGSQGYTRVGETGAAHRARAAS